MSTGRLPAAVLDLAMRLGAQADGQYSFVRLQQAGRIKRKLGTDLWMPFKATQAVSVRECRFDWRARVGPFGIITARDALQDGAGRFGLLAFGVIPVTRTASSAALTRGELMRYLAEIAWAPDAILCNRDLRWRIVNASMLAVSAGTGATACEVFLSLNGEGRIAGAFAPDRPFADGNSFIATPWRGRFDDWRLHMGRWIPFAGEVAWERDGKSETYFGGTITGWDQTT